MTEQTLAIIKPDAVTAGNTGKIIDMIESNGFVITRIEKGLLNKELAQRFYDVHKDKPFFGELVDFIASGPVIVMVLDKENAINDWRKLMGATDPLKAEVNTIRKLFGTNVGHNAVHGSDSPITAMQEIMLFFGLGDDEEDCDCAECSCDDHEDCGCS